MSTQRQGPPSDNEPAAEETYTVRVPSLYVDAAEIHVQPFSVHIVLGENDITGATTPRMHVTMSPNFAIYLRDVLVEATRVYSAPGSPGPAENADVSRPESEKAEG